MSADLRTDDNGNYILTDWEEKKEVSVKTVEPFQIIDYYIFDGRGGRIYRGRYFGVY